MTERNPVRDAVRYALTAGVAASFVGAPAAVLAQDDVAVQDKVTVTGSRIKRVDIEGPSPISVISREDIDATGDISVAEVLRGSSFNSFGSFKQRSGSSAQSSGAVSLRGLGSSRTLVLLDGRRVSGAPTATAGAQANLNTIPLAAVERIEILREGASAVYGSDAIGGVVNIILRKDYEGMQLTYNIGRPTQSGGDEESYSIVGGISGAKGNVTFGFSSEQKDIIYQGDRSFSATGLSSFGFPGSYSAFLTTNDPRNPAMAFTEDTTGDDVPDSNLQPAFLNVGTSPDPRCPANLGTDAKYPNSVLVGTRCRYNYSGVAANESENDTKSFFLNTNYEINETTTFFARGNFTLVESFGRYAPSPFTSPLPTMTQGNANNPTVPGQTSAETGDQFGGQSTMADTDGDGTGDTLVEGPFDLTLFYRNAPGGFRDTFIEDTLVDYLAGVQGTINWLGGMDWEVAGQWSQQTSNSASPGLGLSPFLQSSIDNGGFDPHAVNQSWPGVGGSQATAQIAAAATGTADYRTRTAIVDAQVNFDAFQMKNGAVPIALGIEYRDDDFDQEFDEQSNSGNFNGSSGGADTSGARTVKSLFGETSIPLFSSLDIRAALRYDDYNDFGTTVNPSLGAAYRPIDSLLIRGSWGTGFRAPSMSQLYSSTSQSFDQGLDTSRCATDPLGNPTTGRPSVPAASVPGGNPCELTQYQNFRGGNSGLSAETSDQWGAGVVWSPLDDLSLSFDWYDIELEDQIALNSMQSLLDQEFAQGGVGSIPQVVRNPNGSINALLRPNANISKTETDGFDFEAAYGFSFSSVGDFRTTLNLSHVNEFERDYADGQGLRDPDFLDPQDRATLGVNWALGDFSANVIGNYMSSASQESTATAVDDYTTWDASLSYATPWNGMVTVGARNIFDEDPPTSVNLTSPYYSNQLHDVYGRVPYLRYQQDL